MIRYDLYINGNWQKPASGNYFESDNPYSGEVWAEIARGNAEDVNLAVVSAKNAVEDCWEPMKQTERGKILPRRMTGLTSKQQRDLTLAVKRARIMALLPFVNPEG